MCARSPQFWIVVTKYCTYKYLEYHSVCSLVRIGTPPPPLSQAGVPPPEPKREEVHTRLRVRGWRSPNSNDWRKKLTLCLLCDVILLSILTHVRPLWELGVGGGGEEGGGALSWNFLTSLWSFSYPATPPTRNTHMCTKSLHNIAGSR